MTYMYGKEARDAAKALEDEAASFEEIIEALKDYCSFDEWYMGKQGFGLRCEAIFEDIRPSNAAAMRKWLCAAYKAGQEE